MTKLAPKALCPLHRRRDCCGRSEFHRYPQVKKTGHGIWQLVRSGLWRAPDGREKRSPRELRRLKDEKLRRDPTCQACGERFIDYRDVELSHVRAKGFGGAFRDDSPGNTVLMHAAANQDQGSMDLETYLRTKWRIEICKSA